MEINKNCYSNTIRLYVSGNYSDIKRSCQEFCLSGLCVSIKPVDYVFTMGEQSGAEITPINYPRFPCSEQELLDKAFDLGKKVTKDCFQGSFTLETQLKSYFWSRRDGD